MSKKKVQHKGKPKHSTEQPEDVIFRKSNPDEEYPTVVDFESNKKYNKRLVENNWAKYEAPVNDFEFGTDEEEPKTDDFGSLIKTASSDCSHFQFQSEKLWKDNSVPPSEVFNIDLDVLSRGLECVPFYERLGLDGGELSEEDRKRCDRAAADAWKKYNSVREKCTNNREEKSCGDYTKSTLEELLEVKVKVSDTGTVKTEVESGDTVREDETGNRQKLFSSGQDENLEDWLDSVLDD